MPEIAVFSGDTVRADEEGFLYFIGRRDEMIKTSGYRVSPTEVEEVVYATELRRRSGGASACRTRRSGRRSSSSRTPRRRSPTLDADTLLAECRERLPTYMVPAQIEHAHTGALPRNPNGKIDRKLLATRVRAECPR